MKMEKNLSLHLHFFLEIYTPDKNIFIYVDEVFSYDPVTLWIAHDIIIYVRVGQVKLGPWYLGFTRKPGKYFLSSYQEISHNS